MQVEKNTSYLCQEQTSDKQIVIAELEKQLFNLREGYENNHIEYRKNELVQVNVLGITNKSIKISVGEDIIYGTWFKREYFDKRYTIFEELGEFEVSEKHSIPIKLKQINY
jgi:hypothetical protein